MCSPLHLGRLQPPSGRIDQYLPAMVFGDICEQFCAAGEDASPRGTHILSRQVLVVGLLYLTSKCFTGKAFRGPNCWNMSTCFSRSSCAEGEKSPQPHRLCRLKGFGWSKCVLWFLCVWRRACVFSVGGFLTAIRCWSCQTMLVLDKQQAQLYWDFFHWRNTSWVFRQTVWLHSGLLSSCVSGGRSSERDLM